LEIVEYQLDHLGELTVLYNDLIKPVPHCYPIQANELTGAFAGECGYESCGEHLTQEQVFVALDREVTGFVHVGAGTSSEGDDLRPQGIIRFLVYPRGRRNVGQALLERAEGWLRTHKLYSVLVYRQEYRYPFYHFPHAYVSNHLEHIQALLLCNGYEVCGGEIFLDWPDMDPNPLTEYDDLDIDLEIKQESGQGRLPDLRAQACHEGRKIGECFSLSAAAFSNREVVEDWVFTNWLGISEPYRTKGLGRYLLGSTLAAAREAGYRHAAISTSLTNHRALLFYANCGYHAVDWTRQLCRRSLGGKDSRRTI
jgi:GNAT superfamily N-acetyltransferase